MAGPAGIVARKIHLLILDMIMHEAGKTVNLGLRVTAGKYKFHHQAGVRSLFPGKADSYP